MPNQSDERTGPPVLEPKYIQKILLRVYQNNEIGIPQGVKVKDRKSVAERDYDHKFVSVGEEETLVELPKELTRRGRIRENHRDNGEIIVNGDIGVTLWGFAEQLIADGYQITNFHVAKDTKPAKKSGGKARERFIPTFTLEHGAEPAENADELLSLWNRFADDSYTLYVYANPDDSATFNCNSRGQTETRSFCIIEEGILKIKPIGSFKPVESTEDLDILEAADGTLVGGE